MEKDKVQQPEQEGGDNPVPVPTQPGSNFNVNHMGNPTNLKEKLIFLEGQIKLIGEEMNVHKKNIIDIKAEKESLQELLNVKTHDVKVNLLEELRKVEDEINKHFSHQTSENSRLQQQLTSLKNDETTLQNQLISLQRRISDLEMQVGSDDIKF